MALLFVDTKTKKNERTEAWIRPQAPRVETMRAGWWDA